MKLLKIAALVAAMGAVGAQAAIPVGYANVTSTGGIVNNIEFAADGDFPDLWQDWTTETAWWFGTAPSVVFQFDRPYQITGFEASLDNNDDYVIELSPDGTEWTRYYTVFLEDGTVGEGMDRFKPAVTGVTDFFSYARVRARAGDNSYSVGELQFSGVAAVPEPETLALMLGGIAALGLKLRRRAG